MDALFKFWPSLFNDSSHPRWAATSLPIGAGQPDLLAIAYRDAASRSSRSRHGYVTHVSHGL